MTDRPRVPNVKPRVIPQAASIGVKTPNRRASSNSTPHGAPSRTPTVYMLLAQYGGRAMIPLDEVCRDFFGGITPDKLMRKVSAGDERLIVVRMGSSQKAAKAVLLSDLADYIDRQRETAERELNAISGR